MRAATVLVLLGALALVASAEEKPVHDQGNARARFAFEKWSGDFASEKSGFARAVEGSGTGTVDLDSGATAIWVSYDPDKTSAEGLLRRLKDIRAYDAAKLTSVVACFKSDWANITATATVKGNAKASKRHGEVVVQLEGLDGHAIEVDKTAKPKGRFHPGITLKAPHEIELEKTGKFAKAGAIESYTQGMNVKKGGDDSIITVTVNAIVKAKDGKESLHTIEIPVPLLSQ